MKKVFVWTLILVTWPNLIGKSYSQFKIHVVTDPWYYIYQSGPQTVRSSYAGPYTTQPISYIGSSTLAWFAVFDTNFDGVINNWDFDVCFGDLDTNSNGTLDDEVEISGILEKKF